VPAFERLTSTKGADLPAAVTTPGDVGERRAVQKLSRWLDERKWSSFSTRRLGCVALERGQASEGAFLPLNDPRRHDRPYPARALRAVVLLRRGGCRRARPSHALLRTCGSLRAAPSSAEVRRVRSRAPAEGEGAPVVSQEEAAQRRERCHGPLGDQPSVVPREEILAAAIYGPFCPREATYSAGDRR
jgi:hypothetical protein